MNDRILYEDKYLILCKKEIGECSQLTCGEGVESLPKLLSEYRILRHEDGYIGLVHRLDVTTGGIMLFSKDKNITGRLCTLVSSGEYKKTYLAVVTSCPETDSGEMSDLLYHDRQKNKTYVVERQRQGVKPALLRYSVSDRALDSKGADISLLQIQLMTGRTHQIRAQLSSRGMPLLGDGKYGSREKGCSIALWSYRAEFIHPVSGERISVMCDPPSVYPWNTFKLFS